MLGEPLKEVILHCVGAAGVIGARAKQPELHGQGQFDAACPCPPPRQCGTPSGAASTRVTRCSQRWTKRADGA